MLTGEQVIRKGLAGGTLFRIYELIADLRCIAEGPIASKRVARPKKRALENFADKLPQKEIYDFWSKYSGTLEGVSYEK